ncbi:hypothetical protein C3O85_19505 [Clostridioides difficile]
MNDTINEYLKIFRLPAIRENYPAIADKCAKESSSYSDFLLKILECEMKEKIERSKSVNTDLKLIKTPNEKRIKHRTKN